MVVDALPRIERGCRALVFRDGSGPEEGGVTRVQARILGHLDARDPVMVTELADHLGVTASTMSLNLKRLEEGGHVRRSRDPADRRVVNVVLTPSGVSVRDRSRSIDPARVAALLDRLRPEERRPTAEALVRLADAADAEDRW